MSYCAEDMRSADMDTPPDAEKVGREMHQFITELYPICRSVTGDGVRETLVLVGQNIPLAIREVASGTQVFDWTFPRSGTFATLT